jgi:glycosyltransferase involved in cell wall biosynthesis
MFSIVMPLWNKRPTVAASVAGALAQDFGEFELIIVDDGSSDGSAEEAARFDDPRIRTIAQRNRGPGAARNAGMDAARYEWIAFLDADDLWLPDHLAELDSIRRRHPDAGLIGTAFVRADRRGGFRLPSPCDGRIEAVDYFSDGVARPLALFCTSSSAIPRSTHRSLGGFSGAPVGQDTEYFARIALERPVAISRRVTAVYRTGTGGITDRARSVTFGRELREARDIEPSLAILIDRYGGIACPARRAAVDRLIDIKFRSCVWTSARIGDLRTLRALPGLYLRPPPPSDRLILAVARGPAPLARRALVAAATVKAGLSRLKHGMFR